MRFQILERQCSVLVFEDVGANYVASCQVFLYGDVGLMYNINGHKFYELMAEQLPKVMLELGVNSLEGYITPAHSRLMRIALRHVADVTEAHTGKMAGHSMVWIVVRPKPISAQLLAHDASDETIDFYKRTVKG